MGKQSPFEKFKDSITPMGYVPSQSYAEDVQQLEQTDYFLQNFKTPSDIEEYRNYILDTQFRNFGVQSPYKQTADYRAQFDPEADINNTLLSETDTPEQQLFKQISMQVIANRGKVPVASFIEEAVNSSMTAGWGKMLGDNMFNFKGEIPDLVMLEDGIYYKDKKLNLTSEQVNILNDYNNKITGASKDSSFIEDVAKIATSLIFDAPLLYFSGGIAGGVMKASTVTSALAKSTQYLPRLTGQILQQGLNFNILGIPQTIENTRQNGLGGMLSSIFHNVTTGSLAAFTGTNGVALGKATGSLFLKNNPAIREEFGGLLGSVGFGYTIGKIEGMEDEDAIAQGLAFAATHFTNPTSYKRVITEMKNKNVRVYSESLKNHRDTGMLPDYFVEKDGKYQKIETDAFKREGRIVPMDVDPIQATSENKADYLPINSIADMTQIKFREALMVDRNEKNAEKLYQSWIKDLDPEYVKANADKLRSLAEITSASLVGAKLGQTFSKWKLPQDVNLDNKMIQLSKKYRLPYSDVKRFIVENANEYFANPDDVISRINENPTMATELNALLKVAGETFIQQAKSNYAQELLSRSGLPASKQLGMGELPKPVDLKTEAERIQRIAERRNLKASVSGTEAPVNELKPDKYVFYDFNGELVPMVKKNGKLLINGTNVEIPFETVKDKVKTKAQITKEIKEQKKAETLEAKNEKAFIQQAITDAGGAQKLSPDAMLSVIKKAREEWQTKNPPKEGVKDGQEKAEVLKESQPSETVAEPKPSGIDQELTDLIKQAGKTPVGRKIEPTSEPKPEFAVDKITSKNELVISDKNVVPTEFTRVHEEGFEQGSSGDWAGTTTSGAPLGEKAGVKKIKYDKGDKVLLVDSSANPDNGGEMAMRLLANKNAKEEFSRWREKNEDLENELGNRDLWLMDYIAGLEAKKRGYDGIIYDNQEKGNEYHTQKLKDISYGKLLENAKKAFPEFDFDKAGYKPEIKPETTPISTVDKTTEPNTNIAPSETKTTNKPIKDFEFEKSNFTNVVNKVKTDKESYTTSEAGKAEIRKTLSDIRDFAEEKGVEDYKVFTMQALKEAGLSAKKISNIMKLGGHDVSEDGVASALKKERVAGKSEKYGRDLKRLAEEFTGKREARLNYEKMTNISDKPQDFVEDKDVADLIESETSRGLGEDMSPKMMAREISGEVTNEGRSQQTKKSEKDEYIDSIQQDLKDKGYNPTSTKSIKEAQLANEISKREADDLLKYLSGDRKKPIISAKKMQTQEDLLEMLANNYMGRKLTIGEAIDKAVADGNLTEKEAVGLKKLYSPRALTEMYETRTPTKPMSAEELNAGIKDMESRGFIFEEGIIDQTGVPEGKVRAGVTFKDSNGNIKTVIDKRFAVPDTMEHESFHQYMLKALGNDRKLVDRVLKDYGWDGKENQTLVDAHEAIIDQLAGRKQLSKPVQFIKETFEKFANILQGKGFYSEAQLFRKLANGEINIGKPPRVPDLTFYEKVAGDKDAVRYTLKSFDSILDKETLTINDSFWNRLKNKGVKDAEVNYLKTFLEDGRQLKGDEFKMAVMEKMFPIQINPVTLGDMGHRDDVASLPIQSFSDMTTSGYSGKRLSLSEVISKKLKLADAYEARKRHEKLLEEARNTFNAGLERDTLEKLNILNQVIYGVENDIRNTQASDYRVLSFDIPKEKIDQIHNYWGGREESVGWARVEDEVVNGDRTGYLNVNEIQGQLQYTDAPKWENLKVGDEIKLRGEKRTVTEKFDDGVRFNSHRVGLSEGALVPYMSKEAYMRESKMGSQSDFLRSMKPIFHELQMKSLIQYAADNGYKGVRFPTMKSIDKIEWGGNVDNRLRSKEESLKSWEYIDANKEQALQEALQISNMYNKIKAEQVDRIRAKKLKEFDPILDAFETKWGEKPEMILGLVPNGVSMHIQAIKQEIQDLQNATYPVKKFYEETVGMAGKKLRKENWQKVNDAYGNEWFETKVGAKDTDPIKFYQTVEKPADSKTDMLEFANNERLTELAEWENRMQGQRNAFSKDQKLTRMVLDNKLSVKVRRLGNKLLQSAIQTNNYVNQTDKHGNIIRVDEKGLYDIAKEFLVDKVPLARNTILKNQEGWNEGHHFRMLDGNSIKDYTNRNDLATKINRYGEDIYYGRKDAPELREGETLQQAHERIGKEIGLTDDQIKADWATQEAYRQANKLGYNATVDMFNNLKDVDNSKYVVSDGLSRKQLADVLGIDKKIKDDEAYQMARDIINADPQKRMQIATMLADKSQFAERFNPFYHNNTRPTNPKYWVITGNKPTQVDAEGNILKSDKFFTYAENEKQANQLAREWADKGFLIEENYNIGKEISDKRFNRLSANQLINLANAGHIPINNETIKALLEATKSGRFEQHGLTKKYVPGMHGTGKEYEQQVVNFVDEAVSASVRRYALDKMRDYIIRTDTELNAKLKSGFNMTEQDKERQRLTSEWMHQFYNQVSQSDNSIVDGLREVATTAYIGFKPSFPFMQMFQPLQMALPEAVKEAKGEGLAKFTKSFGTAWDLAYEIRARQKGESTGRVDEELYALYDKLDKMKKMGATGIRELTGEAGDIRLHYGSDSYRAWSTFMKVGNMGGAIAEKYTRLQSLAMWYDIGKSKGLYGKELERFILTKHDEIMSLWGASGRPVLGQSKELGVTQQKAIKAFTKSFFTFKTYTMSNLGQYDRLMRNRQWGALGTKMAVGVGLHGITKMPLMATFYALYNLLSDDDLEYEQIKALDEVNAGLLGRGVSSVLPINLQNMFDERTAFISDAYAETRSKSAEGKLLEAMLGAPYGVPKDVLEGSKAIYDIVKNNIDDDATMTEDERLRAKKNWSKVLPLAARNIFNGMNMKEDGIQVRGRELVKAENISWGDVVYKWLGFNPNKVANAYELQFSGFPAKWTRVNGKIAELKKIRKEISTEKGYTPEERSAELKNVARLLKETMAEQSQLRKTADYKSAYKQGLISP